MRELLYLPVLFGMIIVGLVTLRKTVSKVNIYFSLIAFSLAFWALALYIGDGSQDYNTALLWTRLSIVGPSWCIGFTYSFSLFFTSEKRSSKTTAQTLLVYIAPLILTLLSPTQLNIETIEIDAYGANPHVGPIYYLFFFYVILVLTLAFLKFYFSYKKSKGYRKQQILLVCGSLFISTAIAFLVNIIPLFIDSWNMSLFGPLSFSFFLGITIFAIVRYKFLDIQFIIKRSIVALLSVATFLGVYACLVIYIQGLIFGKTGAVEWFDLSSIVVIAITAAPLQQAFEKLTDKIFFRSRIDIQNGILELTKELSSFTSLNQLDEKIVDSIINVMKIKGVVLLRKNNSNEQQLIESFKKNFPDLPDNFKLHCNQLPEYFEHSNEILITEEIGTKINEGTIVSSLLEHLYDDLTNLQIALIIPLITKGECLGILLILDKKSEDAYTMQDINLLEILSRSAAVAIDNALLYQNLEERVQLRTQELNEKNKYLQILQSIIAELTQIQDFNSTAQKIVDDIKQKLGSTAAFILLKTADGQKVALKSITNTPEIQPALKLLPKNPFAIAGKLGEPKGEAVTLFKGKPFITTKLSDIISPTVPEAIALAMQDSLHSHSIVSMPIITPDEIIGTLNFVLSKKTDLIDPNELEMMQSLANHVGIVMHNSKLYEDVKDANRQLENAYEELKTLDKAKTEFVSIASHQLRTPISIIRGFLSMLIDNEYGDVPTEQKKVLEKTYQNVMRLIQVVDDLLNASRIENGKLVIMPENIQIIDITEKIVRDLSSKAEGKNLQLTFTAPPSAKTLLIKADPDKLSQVIINLIDNAINYTLEGSVQVAIQEKPNTVLISIKDSGIGIPKADQGKLFQRFTRLENAQKVRPDGTGIGLYIAKMIIESHGGKLWFESKDNQGTTFFIELSKNGPSTPSATYSISSPQELTNELTIPAASLKTV
ncbi:MAG: ATP-binding protein [bacterium]